MFIKRDTLYTFARIHLLINIRYVCIYWRFYAHMCARTYTLYCFVFKRVFTCACSTREVTLGVWGCSLRVLDNVISTLSSHAKVSVAVRDKTSYIGTLSSSRQNQSFLLHRVSTWRLPNGIVKDKLNPEFRGSPYVIDSLMPTYGFYS